MLAKVLQTKVEKRQGLKIISSRIEQIDNEDILLLNGSIINRNIFKRVSDIFISTMMCLFILTWLFPIIALLIKISSKGTIFFSQKREGVNKKIFNCLKFRTMKADSKDVDESGKYLQATSNDARITKIGSFLRKTSLDELPQFFNVIRGDMSIVGPRPHPIPLNKESEKVIVGYNLRHLVKPGITGLAQVNGLRGETKNFELMKMRVEHDINYIKNWSFLLDFKIMNKTAKNIIKGEDNAF